MNARHSATILLALAGFLASLALWGCAATPPMPLDQYIALRDGARDYLTAVELHACPQPKGQPLCEATRAFRSELKPADATMIQGYTKGGLSDAQWGQALGVVTGVLGKALKAFLGVPSL